MNKCSECIFLDNYQDMGASTPICMRGDKDLVEMFRSCAGSTPCEWHVTREQIEHMQDQMKEAVAVLEKLPVYEKIIAMFSPKDDDFLNFKAEEVIQGPNDRAAFGFDNFFPVKWLVEDYDFTEEEARWFISEVQRLHAEKEAKT